MAIDLQILGEVEPEKGEVLSVHYPHSEPAGFAEFSVVELGMGYLS